MLPACVVAQLAQAASAGIAGHATDELPHVRRGCGLTVDGLHEPEVLNALENPIRHLPLRPV